MKILVVDDSRVMRQIIIRTLRQAGYDAHDIVEAESGREALAKAQTEQPGLVLCDWHMPDMNVCITDGRSSAPKAPTRAFQHFLRPKHAESHA